MCNHNISRNKKNRSKLVILQSCIFRKWEHFQITEFSRVYMAGPPATFSKNPLNISATKFLYFNATDPTLFLLFPISSIKVPSIKFKDGGRSCDPLMQKAYYMKADKRAFCSYPSPSHKKNIYIYLSKAFFSCNGDQHFIQT